MPASVADAISGYVTDLARVPPHELARWLPELRIAAGWQVGRAENSTVQPTRIAVYRHELGAGWDACETIDVCTFTGSPPVDFVRLNADCSLRALGADDIVVRTLDTPSTVAMAAMRSTGYFNLTEHQRIWVQYSTYIAGLDTPGLLAEQSAFVKMECLPALTDDIAQLSDALHDSFSQRGRLPYPSWSVAAASPRTQRTHDHQSGDGWRLRAWPSPSTPRRGSSRCGEHIQFGHLSLVTLVVTGQRVSDV